MVSKLILIGLALVLVGFIYHGSPFIEEMALAAGTSYTKTELLHRATLVTIPAGNHSYLSLQRSADVQSYRGAYLSDGAINFYVMSEESFSRWRRGEPSQIESFAISSKSHNFTIPANVEGNIYFVFDNRGFNTLREVVFNLSATKIIVEANPLVLSLPEILVATGIICALYGVSRIRPRKDRLKLEKVALSLSIDPEGLSDKVLRKKVEEKLRAGRK